MVRIFNTQVYNLDRAVKASKYPTNLKAGMPSCDLDVTESDFNRAEKLARAPVGSGHDNFLSGILVSFDIVFPQYWLAEFQRYHFVQIVSSQSTMHSLTSLADKSIDEFSKYFNEYTEPAIIRYIFDLLQDYKKIPEKDTEARYKMFMKIRSNLPSGFEMAMHVVTNYLQLKTIYFQRKDHKLREDWGSFTDWIITLPRFYELVLEE